MHLEELSVEYIHHGLLAKDFSATELVEALLKYIEDRDAEYGAFLHVMADDSLKTAREVDLNIARGDDLPMLAGVPIALKDNIVVAQHPTTAGSRILEHYQGAYDATVVKRLKASRAVLMGKTNMDEFAMGSSGENSAFFPTKNPHDTTRVPGGSSSGSAVAVALGDVVCALGSETGGSVRQPASFCGLVGLKPTYGAVSRYGLIAMASSLDQIAPLGRTTMDVAHAFEGISGFDTLDGTTAREYTFRAEAVKKFSLESLRGLTIGIPKEYFTDGIAQETRTEVDAAIALLKSFHIAFREISLPHTEYALACYYIIMPAEVSSNLARFDGIRFGARKGGATLLDVYETTRGEGFGREATRRILLGNYVLSAGYYDAYYLKAQKVRALIAEDFARAFRDVDMILTPATPTPAFKFGEKTQDPVAMYLSDIFTVPVNLAGLPAITFPTRALNNPPGNDGLPVGVQLIGKHFDEATLLGVSRFYEEAVRVNKSG
ncbi:MAG: Asp-tRNA(Asn)/Glu-tRNA(Gln) amidotransferase subunit GatA [Patescibacteria group bacterium]|nr:Asp-tRNA(Asn)/Glu-tRNA(Gln) amidotransferase subunit GatA [Patescibacteria group bacterium]MDE2438096.1 Asp-tRNA(Asn)/Glu-tRNA(Gln) amidotransferase subunit GatA [Patescibacteria group bacterium]